MTIVFYVLLDYGVFSVCTLLIMYLHHFSLSKWRSSIFARSQVAGHEEFHNGSRAAPEGEALLSVQVKFR